MEKKSSEKKKFSELYKTIIKSEYENENDLKLYNDFPLIYSRVE